MKNLLILFLLVCFSLQGGILYAGETIFGRVTADGSADPDDTAAEACLKAVNVTDGEESFSVSCGDTAGGTVKFVSGAQVASANTLDIGEGSFFSVTGTTLINTIETADTIAGRLLVLEFENTVTVTDMYAGQNNNQGSLQLSGNASMTAGDVLMLYCFDGNLWHQIAPESDNA